MEPTPEINPGNSLGLCFSKWQKSRGNHLKQRGEVIRVWSVLWDFWAGGDLGLMNQNGDWCSFVDPRSSLYQLYFFQSPCLSIFSCCRVASLLFSLCSCNTPEIDSAHILSLSLQTPMEDVDWLSFGQLTNIMSINGSQGQGHAMVAAKVTTWKGEGAFT